MYVDTLVLDGMNVFKTALSTGRGLRNGKDMPTGGVFHGLRTILNAHKNFDFGSAVVVWDRAPYWRKAVYPEYKENRKKDRTENEIREFQFEYEAFRAGVNMLGLTQIEAPGFEADDLAYTLSKQLTGKTLLWSNDHDWWQLVSDTCSVYSHRVKQLVSIDNFYKETGFSTPEIYTKIKIIAGDGGDNVIGVSGIGPKKAEKYLNGTLGGKLLQDIEEFVSSGNYELNELLVDLSKCPKDPRDTWRIRQTDPDAIAFQNLLEDLEVRSFNKGQWLKLMEESEKVKFAL
jgi:DNA polymerase-1